MSTEHFIISILICTRSFLRLLLLSFFHWALPLFRFVCYGYFFFVRLFVCSLCVRSQLLVRIDFHCDKMWFTFLFMLSLNFRYEMEIKNRIYIQIKWKYRKMNEGKFAWDYLKIKNHWKIHYILVDRSKLQRAPPYLIAIPFLIFEIEKCISVAAQTKQTHSEKNTKSTRKKTLPNLEYIMEKVFHVRSKLSKLLTTMHLIRTNRHSKFAFFQSNCGPVKLQMPSRLGFFSSETEHR